MWREFGLRDVMVTLFHGHGQEDTSKGRVNNGGRNLFNKRVKTVKMKYGQNPIGESCKRHPQGNTKVCWQIMWGRKGVVMLSSRDIMK